MYFDSYFRDLFIRELISLANFESLNKKEPLLVISILVTYGNLKYSNK